MELLAESLRDFGCGWLWIYPPFAQQQDGMSLATTMDGSGRLLIRADVGPSVGTARVARCLALAQAWIQMGGTASFICGHLPERLTRRIRHARCELIELQRCGNVMFEVHDVNAAIQRTRPAWLVLDGDSFDQNYQSRLSPGSYRVARIGDFPEQGARLNGSELDPLAGFQWALIADELQRTKSEPKRIAARARHLLMAMFAQDPGETTVKCLDAIDGFNANSLSVDVVLVAPTTDSEHTQLAQITQRAAKSRQCVRVHGSIDRLGSLICQTDIAVTDASNFLPELCHLGIPILIIPKENETHSAESAIRNSAIIVDRRIEASPLADIFRSLICDQGMRRRLAAAGRQLVDGDGARRLARQLAAQQFRIRPARSDDAAFTYRWRNDPEVRASCLHSQSVTFEAHCRWLAEKTNSDQFDVLVIEDQTGNLCGQASIDYGADFLTCSLNIHLVPAMRGRGIGTALIEQICRTAAEQHTEIEITAKIKAASPIAQSAFRKAGFQRAETTSVDRMVATQFVWRAARSVGSAGPIQQGRRAS